MVKDKEKGDVFPKKLEKVDGDNGAPVGAPEGKE